MKVLIAILLTIAGFLSMFQAIMALYIKIVELCIQQRIDKINEYIEYIKEISWKYSVDKES